MSLIIYEINLLLTWSSNFLICKGNRETTFAVTDTRIYVPAATFSVQDNT